MQPITLDLNETLAGMRTMLLSMLGDGVELEIQQTPGPALVRADPGQVEQILMNLCVNAREAISGSGDIAITTERVHFGPVDEDCPPWAQPGTWIRLAVRDQGVGIALEIQDKVFEPFFTTRAPGKGTGLGLATVYGITKQHGGFVHLESAPGRGTTVSVYLPPSSGPVEPQLAMTPPAPSGHGETILVVDDEDLVRNMTARILEESGYRVLTAPDGTQALALIQQRQGSIAAVLLDLVLPGMGGREIHAAFQEISPGLATLFMSGFDPGAMLEPSGNPLPGPLLHKPFSRPKLLVALHELLTGTTP